MKGFDDHLDNYGDPNPGGESFYPGETWDGPGDDWYPGEDDDETDEILASPHTMSAIADGENELDDGITTDDFDNWPLGREFPS